MDADKLPEPGAHPRGPEPPPRGVHAMAAVRWALLAFAVIVATLSWFRFARAQLHDHDRGGAVHGPRYRCPMHPQIVSDQPGECPICHMDLEPVSPSRAAPGGTTSAPRPPPSATPPSSAAAFSCPVHPQITSDRPGRCPLCKRELEPGKKAPAPGASSVAPGAPASGPPSARSGPVYVCPMHPQIRAEHPGSCPLCKMDLEILRPPAGREQAPSLAGSASPGGAPPAGSSEPAPPPGSTPPGTAAVHLTLDRIQAIGVRTAVASAKTADHGLRVTAVVEAPEQGVAEVHVRAPGFVESIAVAQTGVSVKRGQPLLTVYSPELYQAQAELLAMRDWQPAPGGASSAPVAARRKLLLLGMSDRDIDRIVAKGEPLRALPVYAPAAGFVAKKNVNLGSYVTPETMLYEIQDLSRVYVVADVFQSDVGLLTVGSVGRFSPTRSREVVVEAKVDLVYPTLNAEARTTRVRMQVKNDKRAFSPGEYGLVEFATMPKPRVVVPRDALVDTGKYTYVFVVEGEGQFSPRTVVVGEDMGEDVAIAGGLRAGDIVVSGATFLVDSESRLEASIESAAPVAPAAPGGGGGADGTSCDNDFDRAKYPEKWSECQRCAQAHHGLGAMEADCKSAIARPWR